MPTVSVQATSRLIAFVWASQLLDRGEPAPDQRKITARVLREVRR
jgi:hypothetical protein